MHMYRYIVIYIDLLSLYRLAAPIAFIDIVGNEEDAEQEEDMKTSKRNEREAQTVVSFSEVTVRQGWFLACATSKTRK